MHEGLFHLLFSQLVQIIISKSIPEDTDLIEPDQELAFYRIERIGFQVGSRLIDRLVLGHRTFTDQLDAFKFICKDYWNVLFRKSIDNLKTNHKVNNGYLLNYIIKSYRVFMFYTILLFLGLLDLLKIFQCQTPQRWQFW